MSERMDMELIIGGRGSGKTYQCVRALQNHGYSLLVCKTNRDCDHTDEMIVHGIGGDHDTVVTKSQRAAHEWLEQCSRGGPELKAIGWDTGEWPDYWVQHTSMRLGVPLVVTMNAPGKVSVRDLNAENEFRMKLPAGMEARLLRTMAEHGRADE